MKYAKMLALAAVAASALLAFIGAGSASAAVICSTTGIDPCPAGQKWEAGTVIDFSIPAGGSALLTETGGKTIDTCKTSTVKGKITEPGGEGKTATGPVEELTWGTCTFPTKTLTMAALEVKKIAGTSNGTVLADEYTPKGEKRFEVTINTVLFGSCIYTVEPGASLGDLTEGKTGTETPPVFHANAVAKKTPTSPIPCPETAKWTATYTMTSPENTTASVEDH